MDSKPLLWENLEWYFVIGDFAQDDPLSLFLTEGLTITFKAPVNGGFDWSIRSSSIRKTRTRKITRI